MNYYLLECPVYVFASGAIDVDKKAVPLHHAAVANLEQRLTATGLSWQRAYSFPGDFYFAYVASELSLTELTQKYDIGIFTLLPERIIQQSTADRDKWILNEPHS